MVKPKEADSPPGPAELHNICNANRFEPYDSVGPYVFGVPSRPSNSGPFAENLPDVQVG